MPLERNVAYVASGAVFLRLSVFLLFPEACDFLTAQVEVSTPISSYRRLREGLFLYERNVSPYDGGLFHQSPLLLILFGTVVPPALIFTLIDIFNASALRSIGDHARRLHSQASHIEGSFVAAAYLFNPFTLLTCLGRSTNLVTNAAIILAVSNAIRGNCYRTMLAISLASYLSLYPALLLPPLILLCWDNFSQDAQKLGRFALFAVVQFLTGGCVLSLLGPIILPNHSLAEIFRATYGAQISVPDLTPNIGLWWYFFIEIFDSFRSFFIGVFWLILVSYTGALTIRLRKRPLFVITTMLGLFAVFKPYPSVSDVSLYLSFLPLYQHIFTLTRYTFIAASVLLYATLLGPAFHYLWIYAGSGNANFFYAITLVWSLGLSILVGDCLFAVLRDDFELERPEMKGKPVRQV